MTRRLSREQQARIARALDVLQHKVIPPRADVVPRLVDGVAAMPGWLHDLWCGCRTRTRAEDDCAYGHCPGCGLAVAFTPCGGEW
ncbi:MULTISPECIES: hypothetical protein [unclassified Crossiella]|uniref:hypothetical protein n=1 Tax=unclassified Crossiella TaxID=2620835 RepID=UPI001FFF3974|nr:MULTISPECIES: hypothetical protein [unclassified Crossiella]MCK2237821.1 hypothetical protein [Crossiella sp. S99.2]MCK2255107.1 hypothetical protein [Crossiella sp. S99.1]